MVNKSNKNKNNKKKKSKSKKGDDILIIKKKTKTNNNSINNKKKTNLELKSSACGGTGIIIADPKPRSFDLVKDKSVILKDDHPLFNKCVNKSYCGFVREQVGDQELAEKLSESLHELSKNGYFHYDCVQYASKVNVTRVQRILVGNPGMTYLYQKLRLFAFPWTDSNICNGALRPIETLNKRLSKRAKTLIETKKQIGGHVGKSCGVGSADFNLTLINAALINNESEEESLRQPLLEFKQDQRFNFGNLAVNWHKDSTLEPFSTIGVYHHTPDESSKDWEIAICCDQPNVAPPLACRLNDRDCYYMLGNFNHHHFHSVVAGKSARFASTHRVAVTANATFDSIKDRCKKALVRKVDFTSYEYCRELGELIYDLEFEWIRQFYIQGQVHMEQHETWWTPRIEQLGKTWVKVFEIFLGFVQKLKEQKTAFPKKMIHFIKYQFTKIIEGRQEWSKRVNDRVYKQFPIQFRPMEPPFQYPETSLLEDLIKTIQ